MPPFEVSHNTLCQAQSRDSSHEIAGVGEPRQSACEPDAGLMQCELLRWAADQTGITPHLQGILIRVVRMMEPDGSLALPQSAIALGVGLGETQTRAAIKALVTGGVLLRKRRGSVGEGRKSDVLQANFEHGQRANDNSGVSELSRDNSENVDVSSVSPENRDNDDNSDTIGKSAVSRDNSGTPPVSNPPRACIEHAGARAETLKLITTSSSSNSEKPECVSEGGPGEDLFGAVQPEVETAPPKPSKASSRGDEKLKRGSRLPPDWKPSERGLQYAFMHGIRDNWLDRTVDNFVGYWSNRAGKEALKLDWDQAWEGEVRKESVDKRHRPNIGGSPNSKRTNSGPYRAGGITRMAYQG